MAFVGVAMLTFALHYNIIYISYRIKSFIRYKILRHPEPPIDEVLEEIIPALISAVVMAKTSDEIYKVLKKHRKKMEGANGKNRNSVQRMVKR
jgi:hypothetical protein